MANCVGVSGASWPPSPHVPQWLRWDPPLFSGRCHTRNPLCAWICVPSPQRWLTENKMLTHLHGHLYHTDNHPKSENKCSCHEKSAHLISYSDWMANLGITQILSLLLQISHLLKQYNPQRHAEKEMSFWIISTTTHQCYPKAYLSSCVFMWQTASHREPTWG